MSDDGLIPEELKQRKDVEIAQASTFETHGVSEQTAIDYLDTPEGRLFRQRLIEADPKAAVETVNDRAIERLVSGRDLPRMEIINEPLVKIVPAGERVRPGWRGLHPYLTGNAR